MSHVMIFGIASFVLGLTFAIFWLVLYILNKKWIWRNPRNLNPKKLP